MRDKFGFITVGHLRSSVNKHGCYFSYLHLLQKKKKPSVHSESKKMKGHENGGSSQFIQTKDITLLPQCASVGHA